MFTHPRWLVSFLIDGGVPKLENIVIPRKGPMSLIDVTAALAHAVVTSEHMRWLKRIWTGPIVVRGVLTADDGKCRIDEASAALVLPNHAGPELDVARA